MNYFLIRIVQGFIMGFSDIVPGVSSTVLSLLFGFYEDLLKLYFGVTEFLRIGLKKVRGVSIDSSDRESLQSFDWKFLIALGIGYGLAIVSVSSLVSGLLDRYPMYVYAVFFGIVLVSIGEVFDRIKSWSWLLCVLFGLSVVLAFLPILIGQGVLELEGLWLILVGFLASIGGVMPGFSGGFILLFFGVYDEVISFVGGQGEFMIEFLYLGVGAGLGYAIFARYVQRIYESFQQSFLVVIGGLITGSLWVLWPFVETNEAMPIRVWPWEVGVVEVVLIGLCITLSGALMIGLKYFAQGRQR